MRKTKYHNHKQGRSNLTRQPDRALELKTAQKTTQILNAHYLGNTILSKGMGGEFIQEKSQNGHMDNHW